jgi:MFS family permease
MREELTPEEIDSGLRYLIKDGLASQALATLTGGAFLVAFALQLGASNYHIGLLAAIPIWGTLSDRFSNKSVLAICGPMFILGILAWTFTTLPEKHSLTLPLLIVIHLVMGISTAGVALSTFNIAMKLAPKGRATNYLAVNTLVNSLAAGTAPIVGGALVDLFSKRSFSITLNWESPETRLAIPALVFSQWDFFFLFAFIIGLASLQLLAFVEEVGHVQERVVLREFFFELRQTVRVITSAAGVRQFPPFWILTRLKNRRGRS